MNMDANNNQDIIIKLASALQAYAHISRNMFMLSNVNVDNGLSSPRVYSIPSMESTLWEGEFAVTWGTPFDALKETFLSKVKAGTILRVYVDGKSQSTAATAWWNNILTGKDDPDRGDIMVDGPAKWEFELTDLSIQLLTEQDGFLLVGDGYTVKKVTIE